MTTKKSTLSGLRGLAVKLPKVPEKIIDMKPETEIFKDPVIKKIVDKADYIDNPKKDKEELTPITFRLPISLSKRLDLYVASLDPVKGRKIRKQTLLIDIIKKYLDSVEK